MPEIGNGPEVPGDRKCTKSGEKCAGAKGFPFVKYASCCDERLVCGTPKDLRSGLWGKFCILSSQAVPGSVDSKTSGESSSAPSPTEEASSEGGSGTGAAAGGASGGASSSTAPEETPEAGGSSAGGATASTGPDATPFSSEEDDDDGSACFPSSATVELVDGSTVAMSELSIGDVVKVGPNEFSRVFMFTHKMSDTVNKFVKLTTSSGKQLTLTGGHYIYADGSLTAASNVVVGAELRLGNGGVDKVVSIQAGKDSGLYNPQTTHGDIVVNGVVSSTYTTAVEPSFAHAILAPFRSLYALTGFQLTALESGGGVLADVAPRGAAC